MIPRTTGDPPTPLQLVLDTWRDVLGVEIAASDDFFEVGGTSLAAMTIVSRLSSRLGTDIPLRTVFEFPEPSQFTAKVCELQSASGPAARQARSHRSVVLTPAQARRAAAILRAPGARHPTVGQAYWVEGPLDAAVLEHALQTVTARHEQLGLAISTRDNALEAKVMPFDRRILSVIDRDAVPSDRWRTDFAELASDAFRWPFDLGDPPLVRAVLWRYSEEAAGLILVIDHLVADGWSYAVFCRELSLAYAAFAAGSDPDLPELVYQFSDIVAMDKVTRTRERERDERFWRHHLETRTDELDLMPGQPRRAVKVQMRRDVPRAVVNEIDQHARSRRVTPFILWLAALASVTQKWSGRDVFSVMSPFAARARSHAGVEHVIGLLAHLYPIEIDLRGTTDSEGLVDRVAAGVLRVQSHDSVDYVALAHEAGRVKPQPVQRKLFFGMEEADGLFFEGVRLDLVPLDVEALYELSVLAAREPRGGVRIETVGVFEARDVKRFVDEMIGVLRTLAA